MPEILCKFRYWQQEHGPDVSIWHRPDVERYVTFEPDRAGLNNVRMAFEYVASIAAFTGRTLVLPPAEPWYLIDWDADCPKHPASGVSTYGDYFDIAAMREFFPVMTAEEFIAAEHRHCRIPASLTRLVRNGERKRSDELAAAWRSWARGTCKMAWNPQLTFICYPSIRTLLASGFDVNTPTVNGRQLVEYNAALARQPVIHFPVDHTRGLRSFGQATGMAGFCYPEMYRLHRRFVKRAVRYVPEVFEGAGRVIEKMGGLFAYNALHIRRNDFVPQFAQACTDAGQSFINVARILDAGEPLYLATDEPDHRTLEVFAKRYEVRSWADLGHRLPRRLIGPVEQLVCAGAKSFIGTRYSTFSQYINRLRCFINAPDVIARHHTEDAEPPPGGLRPQPTAGNDWSYEDLDGWRRC